MMLIHDRVSACFSGGYHHWPHIVELALWRAAHVRLRGQAQWGCSRDLRLCRMGSWWSWHGLLVIKFRNTSCPLCLLDSQDFWFLFPYKDPWTTFLKHLLLDLSFETWLQTLEMFLFSQAVLDLLVANLESEPGVAAERPTAMLFKRWVEGMWVVTMATYESNVPSLGCVAVKKEFCSWIHWISEPPHRSIPPCSQLQAVVASWRRVVRSSKTYLQKSWRPQGPRKCERRRRQLNFWAPGSGKKHEPPFNIQNIIVDWL